MDKIKRIEKYLFDFFSNRYEDLDEFYKSTYRDRKWGIYKLENGSRLLDFLMSIHSIVEVQYHFKNLIPHKFATPEALLSSLDAFKKFLNDAGYQKYLDENFKGENTNYMVNGIQNLKNELIQMIDYTKKIYDYEDTIIPYQELRYNLITHNIPDFITILKSILASVSYAITKTQEGFFHSNVHLILKLLGFEIISEEITNIGRIDATIRFSDKIYIIEFKFNKNEDLSAEALQQIKDTEYALKFTVEKKEIFGIGISFGKETRNINGFKVEQLN
jgi:hypothetical protein